MEYDDGPEDLWDDAEEFERDELTQDHEGEDFPEDASYSEEDMPTDAFDDWRDDANEFEDADLYGDPECW